jgi:hypothetical protein
VLGDDLDGIVILVDLLDEWEEALAGLARTPRRSPFSAGDEVEAVEKEPR